MSVVRSQLSVAFVNSNLNNMERTNFENLNDLSIIRSISGFDSSYFKEPSLKPNARPISTGAFNRGKATGKRPLTTNEKNG